MQKLENYIVEMKQLFCLALPLMLAQLFNSGKGMVDTMMVGNIDKYSLAGISLANSVFILIILFGAGIGVALVSILSRLYAQKDFEKIHFYGIQGVYLNTLLAFVIAIALYNAGYFFSFLDNLEPQTIQLASDYLKILAFIWPLASLTFILRPIMQSFVKNKQLLLISGVAFIINIPLNYLFIYDFGWGAIGSAYSTAACFIFEVAFLMFYVLKQDHMNIFAKFEKIDWYEIKTIFKLGIPISLSIMLSIAMFTTVTFLLADLGETYVGAHHVVYNYVGFIFMFGLGLNFALVQRGSFFIGLNQVEKIKLMTISASMLSLIVSMFTMCFTYIFRYEIADLYTNSVPVIAVSVNIFVISMFYQLFDGLQAVCTGVLRAYKLNRYTFNVSFICYWVIGLSTGHYLAQSHSVYGYWYGFCICFMVAVIVYYRKLYKMLWESKM